jgi:hypothetical protein
MRGMDDDVIHVRQPSEYMRLSPLHLWQIPAGTAIAMALIVLVTSVFSLRRVLLLEPATAFR